MSAVPDDRHPGGPDDVAESLLAAAFDLFSERGPANVSVRQIAQAAGVAPGLVHHYFASKDDLVGAVLDRSAAEITTAMAGGGDGSLLPLLTEDGAIARHGRLMAHLMLDWRDPSAFQSDFPALGLMVERFEAIGVDRTTAKRRAAQMVALIFGWQLYAPFLTAAAGMDDDGDDAGTMLMAEGAMLLLQDLEPPPR
jgi:AcrR family transcriptional regulator